MTMAQLGDGPIPRAAIANQLGVSSTGLSTTRDESFEAGVVTEAGRGMLTFGLPGFAEYIRDEHDLELLPTPVRSIRGRSALNARLGRTATEECRQWCREWYCYTTRGPTAPSQPWTRSFARRTITVSGLRHRVRAAGAEQRQRRPASPRR